VVRSQSRHCGVISRGGKEIFGRGLRIEAQVVVDEIGDDVLAAVLGDLFRDRDELRRDVAPFEGADLAAATVPLEANSP